MHLTLAMTGEQCASRPYTDAGQFSKADYQLWMEQGVLEVMDVYGKLLVLIQLLQILFIVLKCGAVLSASGHPHRSASL